MTDARETPVDDDDPFQYVPGNQLSPRQRSAMEAMREHYRTLLVDIRAVVPPGRCLSIVQTNLQTAAFWTMHGITHRNRGQC